MLFETGIALRYLKFRKGQTFLSLISVISVAGVALGVTALITVLSVMNGLESELRTRLLSLTAHASLSASGVPIADWQARIGQLKGSPGLVGAAPFLDTDAMLSRQPAMSGAVVRGIDPNLEPEVSSIGEAMREGKLSDLEPGSNRIIGAAQYILSREHHNALPGAHHALFGVATARACDALAGGSEANERLAAVPEQEVYPQAERGAKGHLRWRYAAPDQRKLWSGRWPSFCAAHG